MVHSHLFCVYFQGVFNSARPLSDQTAQHTSRGCSCKAEKEIDACVVVFFNAVLILVCHSKKYCAINAFVVL